ncbi:MAG: hypothetical protein L0J32_15935, partial [Brevibacterium sp.]|nr:hypothetical protein [Brevibacterium sp.]
HSQQKAASRDQQPASSSVPPLPDAPPSADAPAEVVPPKPSKAALVTDSREELNIDVRPIEVSDAGPHKSTVIIHDEYEPMELSFFRVLENGMPSSLTIPVLLTEAGSRSVPEVIGWGSGRWYDMFEVTEMEAPMALLSHVDVDAEPAWREAVDIVCAVDSGSIGAYNAQAAEMGRRIGELHSDMAAEFGIVEGRGEPTKLMASKWIERIDWALGRAPLALDSLVPELRAHRAKLQSLESIGVLQKIHGELTLDHVVSSTTDGYSVVKFTDSTNSDPKPVALDLVALLRSVDYAAGFARLQRTGELKSEDGGLVVNGFGDDPSGLRAIYDSPEFLWASQVQNSLLSGYSRARGESLGLGDPVLRAALIDRLLVEVVTELRNRPNWLSVPLATLTLVLKGKPARSGASSAEAEFSAPVTAADASPDAAADVVPVAAESAAEESDKPDLVVEADDALADSDADVDTGSETAESAEPQPRPAAQPQPAAQPSGAARQSSIRRPSPAEQSDAADEEFEDEEDEFVVSPVPATFAARGAASEDSDSTGRRVVNEGKHEKPLAEGSEKSQAEEAEGSQTQADVSEQDSGPGKH